MFVDTLLTIVVWLLLAVWPVAYMGYPLALLMLARWRGPLRTDVDLPWPTLAIVIAAHNEERTIERCVRSCLNQRYPGEPPTILVGLDGCTDDTVNVLRRIESPRLHVVEFERQGKAATQNTLIPDCSAEVVATTDAGAEYMPGALVALIGPFRSSRVGCASGVFAPRRTDSASSRAESSYFALEYRLMRAESELGILAKGSGSVQAFRRSLWRPTPITSDADISLPCLIVEQGKLATFVPDAIVVDDGPRDLRTVYRARRRMATQALANVPRHILDLARGGYWGHAASLTLHKLLRWLAPLAGLAASLGALLLGTRGHWESALLLFATGLGGLLVLSSLSIFRGNGLSVVAGFVVSQLAFLAGFADCVRGSRVTRWER